MSSADELESQSPVAASRHRRECGSNEEHFHNRQRAEHSERAKSDTAIIALGIGLWVCPAKKKRMPALILGAIYFANLAYGLAMVSGPHSTSQLQKLLALDYILGMATCVMIVGVIWLRPRRQSGVEVAAA